MHVAERLKLRRAAALVTLSFGLFVLLSLLRWNEPGIHAYPDTTWYVRNSLLMRGWEQSHTFVG